MKASFGNRIVCAFPALLIALTGLQLNGAELDDDLFAPDRVIQVEVKMDPQDWQAMRIEHRDISAFADSPYNYYRAEVTIDGEKLPPVAVRKKGGLGSAVSTRPSIKIKFDKYEKGWRYHGLDMMTLNNNNQDPTQANQFLVYSHFAKAGVMAPRCNFAQVTVNGEDLGVYSHVESIRKPFFKRYFEKSKGDLYEGYQGDFRNEVELGNIMHKWGPDDDQDALQSLFDLLQTPAPIPLEEIEKQLDVGGFISAWAAEVLIGHADGYSNNRNNWYAYRNRQSGRFYFIPWGADAAFRDPSPYIKYPVPKSVKAKGYLCRRLWELPEVRVRYRKEMQRLLDDVWDEKQILADLDRIIGQHTGHPAVEQEMVELVGSNIRAFVKRRRREVQAELDGPAPDWPEPPTTTVASEDAVWMSLTGSFSTTMRSEPSMIASPTSVHDRFGDPPREVLGKGDASIRFKIEGNEQAPFTHYGTVAMPDRRGYRKGYPVIQIVSTDDSGDLLWNLRITLDPHQVRPGKNSLAVDLFTAQASLSQGWPDSPHEQHRAIKVFGRLELEEFSMEPGAPVSGSFKLWTPVFENP